MRSSRLQPVSTIVQRTAISPRGSASGVYEAFATRSARRLSCRVSVRSTSTSHRNDIWGALLFIASTWRPGSPHGANLPMSPKLRRMLSELLGLIHQHRLSPPLYHHPRPCLPVPGAFPTPPKTV